MLNVFDHENRNAKHEWINAENEWIITQHKAAIWIKLAILNQLNLEYSIKKLALYYFEKGFSLK